MPSGRRKYRVVALAYDKRGRLLSVGRNSYVKTHPIQYKYAKLTKNPDRIFLHAEVDALIKARGKVHKLIISRYDEKRDSVKASKPCDICMRIIQDFGVRELSYVEPTIANETYHEHFL